MSSVFAAVVFTALSIGRASSFAPDASKAQVSAAKIIALINRKPQIDTSSSDGIRLVSQKWSRTQVLPISLIVREINWEGLVNLVM